MPDAQNTYLIGLIEELRKLPHETEWVEFKHNNADPEMIGERLSALANTAALEGKTMAYLTWGVEDETHRLTDTTFEPHTHKIGNEALENWLLRLLTPKIDFAFHSLSIDGLRVVLLEIPRAQQSPVQFRGVEYIRVAGSHTKKLKDHPEKNESSGAFLSRRPSKACPPSNT